MERTEKKNSSFVKHEDFKYEVAPKDTGLKMLSRRLNQSLAVLFSSEFSSVDAMIDSTKSRYASPGEIDFYMKYANCGLIREERWIMDRLPHHKQKQKPTCLVVGCGTGREVFGIEAMGYQTTGVDNCLQMIEGAIKLKKDRQSESELIHCDFLGYQTEKQFDVVFLTYALLNHIPQRKNRVAYLKKAHDFLKEGGQVVLHCDEFPTGHGFRYHVASQLLRLRWWNQKTWEKGDTVRSFLGTHIAEPKPLFYHYYTDHYELTGELREAGLLGWQRGRAWIAQPIGSAYVPID